MRRAYWELHIAIILFGFTAILGKLISVSEGPLVWYRLLFTCPSLYLILLIQKKSLKIPLRNILSMGFIGVLIALHWVTFYGSIKASNASITLSCLAATPLFTSVLEPLITGRKFRWYEAFIALCVGVGMYQIILATDSETFNRMATQGLSHKYGKGIILGLLSALLASGFSVLNKKLIINQDTYIVTFYELSAGWILLSLTLPIYQYLNPDTQWTFTGLDWVWLPILAIVCTTLAYTLSLNSLRHISAFTANLSINLEPVYGILLAYFILQEGQELNERFYWGAAILLSTVIIFPLIEKISLRKSTIVEGIVETKP